MKLFNIVQSFLGALFGASGFHQRLALHCGKKMNRKWLHQVEDAEQDLLCLYREQPKDKEYFAYTRFEKHQQWLVSDTVTEYYACFA